MILNRKKYPWSYYKWSFCNDNFTFHMQPHGVSTTWILWKREHCCVYSINSTEWIKRLLQFLLSIFCFEFLNFYSFLWNKLWLRFKTEVCPLARAVRVALRKKGINHLKVVYSKEKPSLLSPDSDAEKCDGKAAPGSISFVPSVMGLIIGGEVIKDICSITEK